MSTSSLVKTLFLKAPREHVWAYLTESQHLARWFHETKEDLKVGKEYALLHENPEKKGQKLCWGTVLEADKPSKLVYTFTHTHLEGHLSTVTWELVEAFGGTKLTLTHDGLHEAPSDPLNMIIDHDEGWDEHFARLRRVVC
jgi:uncharacterized protein YndB with AHSA1/START domain